jgi:hypothetical protein
MGVAAVAALLAGCAAGSQSSGVTPTTSQVPASVQHIAGSGAFNTLAAFAAKAGRSSPVKSFPTMRERGARFFVSDEGDNTVGYYGYKSLKQLGAVSPNNLSEPQGMCTAGKTVWLAVTGNSTLIHYSASGKVLGTIADVGQSPIGCALDKQGDLAVSNITAQGYLPGSVSIWEHATGTPANYPLPGGGNAYFVAYDTQGNLFVDGELNGAFELFELVKGGLALVPVTVHGATVNFAGGLLYVNSALAIVDQDGPSGYSVIYQTHVSGTTATVVGTTALDDTSDAVQPCITPFGTIIVPDAGNARVEIYPYPAGGAPLQTIVGLVVPIGSAFIR